MVDYRLHPGDYMNKCNRLQLITITNYDYPMSDSDYPFDIFLDIRTLIPTSITL